jgi:capsular polysaccharide biosynthesis protein
MLLVGRASWRDIRCLETLEAAIASVRRGEGLCRVMLHEGRAVTLKSPVDADGPEGLPRRIATALRYTKYWAAPIDLVVAPNATFLSRSSEILLPGHRLCEELAYEMDARGGPDIWEPNGATRQLRVYFEKQLATVRPQSGVHLLVHPKWHHIYTHWFTEALAALFDESIEGGLIDKICVPNGPAYQQASLALSGVDACKICVLNQPVHQFEIAIVPTHALARTWVHPAVIPGLKEFVARATKAIDVERTANGPPIYISREDASARSMLNEATFASELEAIGYRKVIASKLSFAEQAKIISKAPALISPHGSGLTNMIFLPNGAPVMELRPTYAGRRGQFWDRSYQVLAGLMDLPYHVAVFESEPDEETWMIDIPFAVEKARRLLEAIGR